MNIKIFGFFEKVNRATEILVGICFILPSFFVGKEIGTTGFSEDTVISIILCFPFLLFGIVILSPRNLKRDMVMYFLVFLMAGLSCLISGAFFIGSKDNYAMLLIVLGIFTILFSYKYLRKIKSDKGKV